MDNSVVRPCGNLVHINKRINNGTRKECGQCSCWTWAEVSGSPEEKSIFNTRNITRCRIGCEIGCTGDWFMIEIPATTSVQLLPTHRHVSNYSCL